MCMCGREYNHWRLLSALNLLNEAESEFGEENALTGSYEEKVVAVVTVIFH